MHVINARDVNSAYREGLHLLMDLGVPQQSRAGEVLVMGCPVMTVTQEPQNRVLLDAHRRANPFFHLFECLWMLSGYEDATWLDQFVGDFSERFAEPDGRMWGAYGHRWRQHFDMDQIAVCCRKLSENSLDRRLVIAMWDPITDLESETLNPSGTPARDVPCNTHIYPRVRDGVLDITVCCRSNDAYWGAHGANAVHFSFLQEYMAAMIGVGVGRMYQLSNNYHIYTGVIPESVDEFNEGYGIVHSMEIVDEPETWMYDLRLFMDNPTVPQGYSNSFFRSVAHPMWMANLARRRRDWQDMRVHLSRVEASDWRKAGEMWVGE